VGGVFHGTPTEDALYHAERYLEYCKKCKVGEVQSLAENIRLQTIVQPVRLSQERREALLEAHTQLERGIQTDRAHEWYHAQVEKQLLLVEVLEELGRLQEEDAEEIVTAAAEILDDAETVCKKIGWKSDIAYLKYEIAYLRATASIFLHGSLQQLNESSEESSSSNDNEGFSAGFQETFDKTRYLQQLFFAIQNESLPAFERLLREVCDLTDMCTPEENALKRRELLTVKGMIYYFLIELDNQIT
jgi:hypothetical protein